MTDSLPPADAGLPSPGKASLTVRAGRKAQRMRRANRREACFELMSAGHSYAEVATALKLGVRAVRRDVARAIEERRLDAPERYVHFQVDRLTRALRSADDLVERGDMKAVTPLIKLVGALDRYHGLDSRYVREPALPPLPGAPKPLTVGKPLTIDKALTIDKRAATVCESVESDAQAPEKARL